MVIKLFSGASSYTDTVFWLPINLATQVLDKCESTIKKLAYKVIVSVNWIKLQDKRTLVSGNAGPMNYPLLLKGS